MDPELIEFYRDLLQEAGYEVTTDPPMPGLVFEYSDRMFNLFAGTKRDFFVQHQFEVDGVTQKDCPRILDAVNDSNMMWGGSGITAIAMGLGFIVLKGQAATEHRHGFSIALTGVADSIIEVSDRLLPNLNDPTYTNILQG